MSRFPLSFSRLSDECFPAAKFGAAIRGELRALMGVLADRDRRDLSDWLTDLLCNALGSLIPKQETSAAEERARPSRTILLKDWESPPHQGTAGTPTSHWLCLAAQGMRADIETLLTKRETKLGPLDQRRVHQSRRHRLFHPAAVNDSDIHDPEKKTWFKRLADSGHEREIVRVTNTMIRRVERLLATAPNLCVATRFVLDQLALAQRDGQRLRVPPLLLVGPPAAGKTWWAEELAHALGVTSELIPMGAVTSSFELSGNTSSWNAARPGRILRAFIGTTRASPVFVLDEVEKISAGNYDPAPVLLYLTEPLSAARFRDEFFDAEFDVSRAIIIATANDPGRMDPALRSRFKEIEVKAPTRNERLPIIASLWRDIRHERRQLDLPKQLEPDVLAILADNFREARQARRLIEEGLGHAAHRPGPLRLLPCDVGGPRLGLVRPPEPGAKILQFRRP